ncbi:kinase-like protein [Ceratobasidium sp. AG-I]|nr:kinase-like protein [Ceratobasidium sp. AG-I]
MDSPSKRYDGDKILLGKLGFTESGCIICQIRNIQCSNLHETNIAGVPCLECVSSSIECLGNLRPQWLASPNAIEEAAKMVKRHIENRLLGTQHTPYLSFDHLIPVYTPRMLRGRVRSTTPGEPETNRRAKRVKHSVGDSSGSLTTYIPRNTPAYPAVPLETRGPSVLLALPLPVNGSLPPLTQSLSQASEETLPTLLSYEESSANVLQPGRPSVETVSSKMTAREMFECLLRHGCADLSSRIDPDRYSSAAFAGGSFGDIWRGRLFNGEMIAVKCLRFHIIKEDGGKSLKRAMRELYIWSKAEHTNIQPLIGIIMFQGRLGMVSPWMEHGNLQEYIDKQPDTDRYDLCVQIASGVSYLHSIEMVHGDLKALNILVSHDGVAKISDFDHSILADCTLAFSATTSQGGGTLRWMAPELLLGTNEEDDEEDYQLENENENGAPLVRNFQTDVYALGMTMLETISGRVPYAEYRRDQGIYRALNKKRPPTRPEELANTDRRANEMWILLLSCWDHDPAARPAAATILSLLKQIYRLTE